jgi:ketosteroid isomerase-like protein
MNGDEDEIRDRINDYKNAINSDDFEGWLSLWAEDGIQMPPNTSPKIGIGHIRGANKGLFNDLAMSMDVIKFHAIEVFNGIGISVCEYCIEGVPKVGGKKVSVMKNGKALTVFKKDSDGSWKIHFDCFNSNI